MRSSQTVKLIGLVKRLSDYLYRAKLQSQAGLDGEHAYRVTKIIRRIIQDLKNYLQPFHFMFTSLFNLQFILYSWNIKGHHMSLSRHIWMSLAL